MESQKQVTLEDDEDESSEEILLEEEEGGRRQQDNLTHQLLHLSSARFQPSLALLLDRSCSKLVVPDPSAPTYLNLQEYSKAVPLPSESPKKTSQIEWAKKKRADVGNRKNEVLDPSSSHSLHKGSPKSAFVGNPPGRRFLPHQMPVYTPRVKVPDTIKIMETIQGPLAPLWEAIKERKRIKIWTRRDQGIRGYLTGFLVVFDKHWNMALRDVDEVLVRRRKEKLYFDNNDAVQAGRFVKSQDAQPEKALTGNNSVLAHPPLLRVSSVSSDLISYCRVKLGALSISSEKPSSKSTERKHGLTMLCQRRQQDPNGFRVVGLTKRMELVERHVSQLFIMGNDVVLVETMKMSRL